MPIRQRQLSRWFVPTIRGNATAEVVGKSMNEVELTFISQGCGCNVAISLIDPTKRAGFLRSA